MDTFPTDDVELTQLLVVGDLARSRDFFTRVLGASIHSEYGGDSVVLELVGNWLLLVTGGPPTPGKPGVTFAPPADPGRVDHQLTFKVPDCRGAYEVLCSRGAEFLAPPVERPGEIRAFFRDPDGRLIEISEST